MIIPSNVIGIHGVPRSGTSWLGQLINSSPDVAFRFQPLFSYAFKSRLKKDSSGNEIQQFFKELYLSDDPFLLQTDKIKSKAYPDFYKKEILSTIAYKEVRYHYIVENLLSKALNVKIIGIIRNPCAVINSWINAPKEFNPKWDIAEEWRNAGSKNQNKDEEYFGFEKWKEVAELFIHLSENYNSRFYLLKYEDLVLNPLATVTKLFDFCGLYVENQTKDFVVESTQTQHNDTYAVYRNNKIDVNLQNNLPFFITESIMEELKGTPLEQFL